MNLTMTILRDWVEGLNDGFNRVDIGDGRIPAKSRRGFIHGAGIPNWEAIAVAQFCLEGIAPTLKLREI